MAIQTQDFYANGLPTGIQANVGVVYTNLADGMQYKQKAIPFGSYWVSLGTKAYFYYQSSGSLPSQSGKAGKYLKTDGSTASWEEVASGVSSVSGTAPIVSSGGLTPAISIPKASATQDGYLYKVDWATFNAKQDAITKGNLTEATSSVLTITGGTASVIGSGTAIQVKQANTSQSGYLSSADWNTFNAKTKAIKGEATVDFTANGYLQTITVMDVNVSTTSSILVEVDGGGVTATHNAYEHRMVSLQLTTGNIINGVSFDIYVTSYMLLTGTFNLKYIIT
jgi:hypothetical protein